MRAGKGNVITPQRNHDILFIKLNVCFTWHWQPCLAMNLISPLFINEAVDLLLVLLYRDLPSHPSDWEIISAKSLTALTPTHSPCLPHAYGLCGLATVRILLQGKCWSHSSAGIIYPRLQRKWHQNTNTPQCNKWCAHSFPWQGHTDIAVYGDFTSRIILVKLALLY